MNLIWNTNLEKHISFGSPQPSIHQNSKPEYDENSLIHRVHFVISDLPISNERLESEETRKDPIL